MRNLISWRGALCLLLLAGSFGALWSQEPGMPEIQPSVCRPLCPGVGNAQPAQGLTEDLLKQERGDTFIASPNEEWIVSFRAATEMSVAHVPTGKTWSGRTPAVDLHDGRRICFSRDGSQLFFHLYVVPLTPGMSGLGFRPMEKFSPQCFVGSSSRAQEPGKIAWSPDGRVAYVAAGSQLRILPPGKLQAVDFSAVERAEREDTDQALKSMEGLFSQVEKEEGKAKAEEARRAFRELAQGMAQGSRELEQLAVSPDGRYLAAIAEKSGEGNLPTTEGVIISLRHQPPVARRFAVNVSHRILWAEHGSRIYFYAQPVAGGGNGTVYQLDFKDF
jgi:hypothetical protein